MTERRTIVRFLWNGTARYGAVEGDDVVAVEGSIYDDFSLGERVCRLQEAKLLPPVEPKIIVGVGGNFLSVIKQVGREVSREPEIFVRPGSTVAGPRENILYPRISRKVMTGVELAIVMKRRAWEVDESHALDYVLGYSCGNHVSAFDLFERDNWRPARAQGHPTHNPLGPWIRTGIAWDNLGLVARLNGTVVQKGHTSDLIFGVPGLVSFISASMILEPGDVIMAGQPGTNELKVGDTIEAEIDAIGSIANRVVAL